MAVQKAVQRVATRVGLMVVKMVVTRVSLKAVNWDHSTVGLMDLMKVGQMVLLMVVEMDTQKAGEILMALWKDLLLGTKSGIVSEHQCNHFHLPRYSFPLHRCIVWLSCRQSKAK